MRVLGCGLGVAQGYALLPAPRLGKRQVSIISHTTPLYDLCKGLEMVQEEEIIASSCGPYVVVVPSSKTLHDPVPVQSSPVPSRPVPSRGVRPVPTWINSAGPLVVNVVFGCRV